MWLSFYNPKGVGDVLMLVAEDIERSRIQTETQANITRIYDSETNETVGYNVFDVSNFLTIKETGHVTLDEAQLDQLNQRLYEYGFEPITLDQTPRIVVAKVTHCEPHKDSNHLSVTEIDDGEDALQIVCGAANVREGLTTIVALPGAVMPNGQIIRPGRLRGVDSYGMLCSAYELGLDPKHEQQGIIELSDTLSAGTPLDEISF